MRERCRNQVSVYVFEYEHEYVLNFIVLLSFVLCPKIINFVVGAMRGGQSVLQGFTVIFGLFLKPNILHNFPMLIEKLDDKNARDFFYELRDKKV
jgi:hypothetical protein